MRRSLLASLVLSTSVALVAGLVFVSVAWTVFNHYEPQWVRQQDLKRSAAHFAKGVHLDAGGRPVSIDMRPHLRPVLAALPRDFFIQVLDANGDVVLHSGVGGQRVLPASWRPGTGAALIELPLEDLALQAFVLPVRRGDAAFYMVVVRSHRFDQSLAANDGSTMRATALLVTLSALVLFAAVVFVTVHRMLGGLRETSAAAARIDPANLAARLSTDGVPREIAPLIDSFNAALGRLERGFRVQQEFLATAAHELKTPIALMRGEVELEGSPDREVLLRDLDHMARQVHQLLHLAEVSDQRNFTRETLDVADVVDDAIGFLARLTQSKALRVEVRRPRAPVIVEADRGALFVLARNLIENAAQHAPPGSTVRVTVDRGALVVRDEGPGIAEADLPRIFDRFWRGAARRDDGAGLGLAICAQIVEAHGWTLSARSGSPGAVLEVGLAPG